MSKIIAVSTMVGGSFAVGEKSSKFTISEIEFINELVVEIRFKETDDVFRIPYHNISGWFVQKEE